MKRTIRAVPRRTVKPELFKHERLFDAERDYKLPLRLVFIGLCGCSDREGRFRWQPRRLKSDIVPFDEVDMNAVLEALSERGFVVKYEWEGEWYGYIPGWHRHQVISQCEQVSAFLAPPSDGKGLEMGSSAMLVSDMDDVPASAARGALFHEQERVSWGEAKAPVLDLAPHAKSLVREIFEYWKTMMGYPRARLDGEHQAIIVRALRLGYSKEELLDAITGCSYTSYNMGKNEYGERYDSLHTIFLSGAQIDRFIRNHERPERPVAKRLSKSSGRALEKWVFRVSSEDVTDVDE